MQLQPKFVEATLTKPKVKVEATHIPQTESAVGTISNKYCVIL